MYQYKVIETNSTASRTPSYGIQAAEEQDGICTYLALIPDISCSKEFVEALARRCTAGQLSPIQLLDVVLDALS